MDGALERFADNEEIYEKYLNRFQSDTHMEAVQAALREGDYQKVLEQAHAMKGMTGTLGMDALYKACSAVVSAVRAEQYQELPQLVAQMQESYERVMTYYQA